MKRTIWSCWCGIAVGMALCGCVGTENGQETVRRSADYTRGIGVYPGNPKEDFSPELVPDDTYRNLARMRATRQSSAFDYNLTSQLTTDGRIAHELPPYFVLSTPEGEVPKREKEWMIDGGPYSRNTVYGEDTYFQFALKNYRKSIRQVHLIGTLAYDAEKAKGGYELTWEGSPDGQTWTTLATQQGKGLPGAASRRNMRVNDPNKQTGELSMPARRLDETFTFSDTTSYANYRLRLKMKGAYAWIFHEAEFANAQVAVDLKPSQYFTSAWMSASTGEEWIEVDLGTRSEFDQIVLHWLNKAVKGKIQISDDASTWKDLAALPGGENPTDVIQTKGKARYVRVWMEEPAHQERYMLSEIEINGRGGLTPRPASQAPASEGKINLAGGNWRLQRASEVTESGETLSTSAFEPKDWIVATVPGTVLSSYKNIGALPNPNYADNQRTISESFFNANFWYRNEFEVPEGFKRECVLLNFDGINWKANIFLNGQRVGRIEGAFMRGQFDVTSLLQAGKNVLAVEIIRNEHIGAVKEKNKQSTDFNGGILGADNPTFHASIGWDWIPTIRGRNIGIWNDVFLTSTGQVTVQDPYVATKLPLPDTTSARLTPEVVVKNHGSSRVEGILKGEIGDITFEQPVTLEANETKTVRFDAEAFPQLQVKHPRLWWPNGYGTPYLYDARFTFTLNKEVSDTKAFKVGIRQMDFNEDNHVLNLFINGRRFIGMGGNWGFSESNLNYRKREYETAVAYHADMNFTMLRNWVGMIGDEELYEACDEQGIMVWQDFWLANPSDGPDPYDPAMFIANAQDYVKRIRNHASIGLYCGRNEGYPPKEIDDALRQIVRESHPDIHYISSSADDVVSGHGPYRMLPAKDYFTLKSGNDKFHSERGMPNVMTYESFLRTYSPEGIWPQSDEWGLHDYTLEGAQGAASFNDIIAQGYGKPQSAREFAELAQWVNYNGHRSLFESRSAHRMGLLMWMSHPCWPSMVWQTYDYYFEPTAAYFAIKKACEPLHVQWNPATDEVEVVNYHAGHHPELSVDARVLNMDGAVALAQIRPVDSREDTTEKCIQLKFPDHLTKIHFIWLRLMENYRVVSENFYVRSKEENNYQELKQLARVSLTSHFEYKQEADGTWQAIATIENPSSVPALMVRLNVVGEKDGEQFLPIFYADNYFALLPGEKKTVRIHWKEEDTRGQRPRLEISGYNVD